MNNLLERLQGALAADDDYMIASGDDLMWLAAQLACWPERVDPAKTKNDRFLRMSGAATLQQQAATISLLTAERERMSFQARVQPWMMECFGLKIARDKLERADRATEEMLELSQAVCAEIGVDFAPRAHALVDYVAGRSVGEPAQEVGGVMVTLAALCLAAGLDMHEAGEAELARINVPETIAKIRAKQAAKPTGSALPIALTKGTE